MVMDENTELILHQMTPNSAATGAYRCNASRWQFEQLGRIDVYL